MNDEDLRPRMFALARDAEPFALATIFARAGGPRAVGSQMVITDATQDGFLSDGCIEADVALHGRAVLADGEPRRLVYGQGSPFIDMRLPCGGRLDVLVERVGADDLAMRALEALSDARVPAVWESDGRSRCCAPSDTAPSASENVIVRRLFEPVQRLVVVGSDPFGEALADLGVHLGWATRRIDPLSRSGGTSLSASLLDCEPDTWTAIAVATHDADLDREALAAALPSRAGYVGVLGSRRRLPERLEGLAARGVGDAALARLRAPIGIDIDAQGPVEVAVSIAAEIIRQAREASRSRAAALGIAQ